MPLPWVEKYRPQNIDQIVSHERIKKQIQQFIDQNALPNLLFHGPAGVGKTTLIKSIARQLFGENYQQQIIEINASDENGIDVVRDKINAFVKTKQLFVNSTGLKLVVLDECDQMSSVAQGALRRIIELSSSQARFCLICNYVSKIIPPLQSRCAAFRFRPVPQQYCIEMLERVSQFEHLNCPQQMLNVIYDVSCGDMRQAINLLESCMITGKPLTQDLVYEVSARPSSVSAHQFIQPMTYADRFEYIQQILSNGVSLEDFIQALYKQMISDQSIEDVQKCSLVKKMAEYEEALSFGADLRSQIAGLVAIFTE